MVEIIASSTFGTRLKGLRDVRGRAIILTRIDRLAAGNPADVRPVGEGISEMRISFGPGYRVYFKNADNAVVVLLGGGDKSSQAADILKAIQIALAWRC